MSLDSLGAGWSCCCTVCLLRSQHLLLMPKVWCQPKAQTHFPWAVAAFAKGQLTDGRLFKVQSYELQLTLTQCFSLALGIKYHHTRPISSCHDMKQKFWAAHLFRHDWTSTSVSTNLQPAQVVVWETQPASALQSQLSRVMPTFARRECPSAWRLALAFLSAACALLGAERLWGPEAKKLQGIRLRRSDRNSNPDPSATEAFISDVTLLETIWFWAEMQKESKWDKMTTRSAEGHALCKDTWINLGVHW